ncbi:MAG TPA: ABC transporter permease [Paracoccaceae bacterium]|nr:ABC transporter permease [Paracoccaceae bacterium]HMO71819.1 ABC transporter permease [Paracoccaceae bacterium]
MTLPPVAARPPRPSSLRTIGALVLREMSVTNGRTALGYLWEVMEPVAGILVLTVAMTVVFRAPPLGSNFALFYASGLLPFIAVVDTANKVANALRAARPLLAYPGVTWLDAILARFLLSVLTKTAVTAGVLAGIVVLFGLSPLFDPVALVAALAAAFVLALTIGLANCVLFHLFPAWEKAWAVVNRPLFLVSAVIFTFESVPEPMRGWLWWNPLVHVVAMMRHGIYPTYKWDYAEPLYLAGIAAVLVPVSLFVLRRHWRRLVNPDG